MLEENKNEILKKNYFLNKIKDGRKKDLFHSQRLITFYLAFIFSLIFIVFLYFVSPYSKTYHVSVTGNIYMSDEDIRELANLNDYFLFTFPKTKEKELKQNPLIEDVDITMFNGNLVNINVKETKAIGYIYEDDESKLLLVNDDRLILDKDNMYLINKVPLIEGYTKEELSIIEKGFEDIDYETINEISEIHKYPISYDDKQLEVIMRDGNYCFLSYSSLSLLKEYYSISSSIDTSKGHVCIYMDSFTNSAYASTCPWQADN